MPDNPSMLRSCLVCSEAGRRQRDIELEPVSELLAKRRGLPRSAD